MSTAANGELKRELATRSYRDFENFWLECINNIQIGATGVNILKKLDRAGIDILYLNTNGHDIDIIYQCKGLETKFDESNLKDCIKSIRKFKESGYSTVEYYLVINRDVHEFRKDLESELKTLVVEGKAKKALLLDIDNSLKYLKQLLSSYLKLTIRDLSLRYYEKQIINISDKIYFSEVPANLNGTDIIKPISILANSFLNPTSDGHGTKQVKYLLTSEFGFGKSTLMLNLSNFLNRRGYCCIYIPVALLDNNSLSSQTSLVNKILELLIEDELEPLPINKYKVSVLKQLLRGDPQFIVFLDGIDENPIFYKLTGLNHVFGAVDSFKSIILSVRNELWEERNGNFEEAMKGNGHYTILFLKEWDKEQILGYLKELINLCGADPKVETIKEFMKIINSEDYSAVFGDIPKRPLFLEMLISDYLEERRIIKNLTLLYDKYLQGKFVRDLTGSFKNFKIDRSISLDGDKHSIFSIIDKALSQIAGKMLTRSNEGYELQTVITEREIIKILDNLKINRLLDLLLHSVLMTFGKRVSGNLKLRFAHKSFQEYYTAKYIVEYDNSINLLYPSPILEAFIKDFRNRHNLDNSPNQNIES